MDSTAGPRLLTACRLTTEKLGAPPELSVHPVTVEGVSFYLRVWSAEQLAALVCHVQTQRAELKAGDNEEQKRLAARLVAMTVCDEDGNLIYATEDVPALCERWPATALVILASEAAKLNRLGR